MRIQRLPLRDPKLFAASTDPIVEQLKQGSPSERMIYLNKYR